MSNLIDDVQAWEAAPFRPNGRHEAAWLPHPEGRMFAFDFAAAAAFGIQHGADTIGADLGLLPLGLDAYGTYLDNLGGWPQILNLRQRLNPAAVFYSYTIFGNRAHVGDVEPGALHPTSFARLLRTGGLLPFPGHTVPGGYTSAGNADALFDAVGIGGLPHDELPSEFVYQSAHYGVGPHTCHPRACGFRAAHSTQWDDAGPAPARANYDRQLWLPGVLRTTPQPPPSEDIVSVTSATLWGIPHVIVEAKDGSLWYTFSENRGSWDGGEPGKRIAGLTPFAPAPSVPHAAAQVAGAELAPEQSAPVGAPAPAPPATE